MNSEEFAMQNDLPDPPMENRRPKAWEALFPPHILERGRNYADSGKVSEIQYHPGRICAKVAGQEIYEAAVCYKDADVLLELNCTCPYAADGKHCKHSAALLYALDLDWKPFEQTEAWDDFDELSDPEESGGEFVDLQMIFGDVPGLDEMLCQVAETIRTCVSDIPEARRWGDLVQLDRSNGELTIPSGPVRHEVYEALIPQMCKAIAKTYPDLPFQAVAEYSECWGDSREVCVMRYVGKEMTVLHIASGRSLAICPECDADVLDVRELAEILIDDPQPVLFCACCGMEFHYMELFADDWGLVPNWVVHTYDMTGENT